MRQSETVRDILIRFNGDFTVILVVNKEIVKICRTDNTIDYNNFEDGYGCVIAGYWQYFCNTKTLRIELASDVYDNSKSVQE